MLRYPSRVRLLEIWRYYQAGVLNTVFGIVAYSLLVWLGTNMFVAQFIAHVMGVSFNYLTYSRHVFRDAPPAKMRFFISYLVNYLLSLTILTVVVRFIASPYLAGLCTMAIISVINYFGLKHLVFKAKAA